MLNKKTLLIGGVVLLALQKVIYDECKDAYKKYLSRLKDDKIEEATSDIKDNIIEQEIKIRKLKEELEKQGIKY
jgi:hypothetical protein